MGTDKKQRRGNRRYLPGETKAGVRRGSQKRLDRWRQEAFQEEGPEISEGCLAGLPWVTYERTELGEATGRRRSAWQTVAAPGSSSEMRRSL